ncbi:MAG TPA: flagellar basal body-associated FliL family protein [Opitutaceae bacterium]|nr:flagellar basal body-associated FliL family protein [Opitutaceae bacterium]
MPPKPEAKEVPAGPAAATDKPAPAEGAKAAIAAALRAWLPALLALALAPALSWGVAEFVVIPRLRAQLTAPPEDAAAKAAPAESGSTEGEKAAPGGDTYEFSNVVVNLAGTMGTRYLKTSFVVTGAQPGIKGTFDGQRARLTDVTLSVLSSLTLADLEEPGAKNVIREKLVAAYNQALGKRVADQVYFSDFVVQ